MSVLIPADDVFNYVMQGIERSINGNVVTEYHSHNLREHFRLKEDKEKENTRLVTNWKRLNDLCYSVRYGERPDRKISVRRTSLHQPMSAIQLIKYLICLSYNIERDTLGVRLTEQDKKDLDLLDKCINDIQFSVIDHTPEWKEARWSD